METNSFNLNELNRISGGDQAFIQDMVELFITQTENSVAEIDQCFISDHPDNLPRVIHKMKPSILIMGMEAIYARILNIEKMSVDSQPYESIKKETDILKEQLTAVLIELKKL